MSVETLVQQSLYALVDTRDELKPFLGISSDDTGEDERINQVNNMVSDQIETFLDRLVVTRGSITEYHTFLVDSPTLYASQWPLISVTSIHEDTNRTYGASTLLTVTTDYIVHLAAGKITRVHSSGGSPRAWQTGFRAVEHIFTAGYATTATVPAGLKYISLRVMALAWREVARKQQGVASVSDDLGSVTRLFPAGLTPQIKNDLFAWKRSHFSATAAQVDT